MSKPSQSNEVSTARTQFTTTHWSLVLAAKQQDSPQATDAMGHLCRAYWFPLYAHARRRGHDHHAAEDLTQEFFARLLEKQWLNTVAPEKGRFRTFLLAALDHFLANERRNGRAAKRGGTQKIVSFDVMQAGEERFAREPIFAGEPAMVFDKSWAAAVLDQALLRLRQEFSERGKADHFEDWKVFLTRNATGQDCQSSSQRLGMSAGAVTVAVHRMRERYGELLRETVAHTVRDASSVDEELRYLFEILNR